MLLIQMSISVGSPINATTRLLLMNSDFKQVYACIYWYMHAYAMICDNCSETRHNSLPDPALQEITF